MSKISDKNKYPHYDGKRFRYPEKWAENGLAADVRISKKGTAPTDRLPVFQPDFHYPNPEKIYLTWFGHSTVLLHTHTMHILFDPIFSDRASPVQWAGPKRFTYPSVNVKQLPHIDLVLLSHDHYDHLDKQTIKQLIPKTDRFLVSVGLEQYLLRWGVPKKKISPLAWWDSKTVNGLEIHCTPSRHFSGRGLLNQNGTQWCSFVLRDASHCIFNSCDGSIGGHFREIQKRFGGFDFALMECGQYNQSWHYSHLYPEESVMAAQLLKARRVMPIHWGAFVLSVHGWDDSPERFVRAAEKVGLPVLTPHLCETITTDDEAFARWWRDFT